MNENIWVVLVTYDGAEWVVFQTAEGQEEAAQAKEDLLVSEGVVDACTLPWDMAQEQGYVS